MAEKLKKSKTPKMQDMKAKSGIQKREKEQQANSRDQKSVGLFSNSTYGKGITKKPEKSVMSAEPPTKVKSPSVAAAIQGLN